MNTPRMSTPDAMAERRKLAHTLGVEMAALQMLESVPGPDVRALRLQVVEALFQADRHHFARMAALTKAVPAAVAAKLSEATLPPVIAARTAELLEPSRAADMVGRLSDRYLADVSAAMDASRAPEVIAAIPPERVAAIGLELARREEWVVIGGFVAHISPEAMATTVPLLDGGSLLKISFVLEDLDRLDTIGGLLSDSQIDELLGSAAEESLWRELTDLVGNLEPPRVERMVNRLAQADATVRERFAAAVGAGELGAAQFAAIGTP